MPRVNRDLQRRMAARRERERRRPNGERRYRFAAAEPELETEPSLLDEGDEAADARAAATTAPSPQTRPSRASSGASSSAPPRAAKPFSAYREEYAYVSGDLRRVGIVVGSLLVALIVLFFVLPLLSH